MEGASSGIEITGQRELNAHSSAAGADVAWLCTSLAACAARLPCGVARATVEIVRDDRMRALHASFSGDDTTTDVLTFASNAPGAPIECDIAICVDEAARRAPELGHTTAQELLLYSLHGLLHACGMDDHDPEACAAMHAEEDRILTAIGVGPLYAPRSAPPGPSASGGRP